MVPEEEDAWDMIKMTSSSVTPPPVAPYTATPPFSNSRLDNSPLERFAGSNGPRQRALDRSSSQDQPQTRPANQTLHPTPRMQDDKPVKLGVFRESLGVLLRGDDGFLRGLWVENRKSGSARRNSRMYFPKPDSGTARKHSRM